MTKKKKQVKTKEVSVYGGVDIVGKEEREKEKRGARKRRKKETEICEGDGKCM